MSTFAYRFVGLESLPPRLNDIDREMFFSLKAEDIVAVRGRFRSTHLVAAALQVLFLRAMGRPMERGSVIPRNLLRYVADALQAPAVSIASLRSLYERRPTQYEHQQWARNYLGIKDLDDASERDVTAALGLLAAEASHANDLIVAAAHWLYDNRILIPGERRLQDWARDAFASVEAQILKTITAVVPAETLQRCRTSVYSQRPSGGMNHLEWLRIPPKRHAPSSIAELMEKIRYLKSLTVHEWPLNEIALAKQRAYAQQVQSRRPVKSRELKETRQKIELVCFLRITLLEFTDNAVYQQHRRSQDLFRAAANKAKEARITSDSALRQQAAVAREILRDESKSWRTRCTDADQVLTDVLDSKSGSFLAQVREALTEDFRRVRAHLNGIVDLEFDGDTEDPGIAQWTAWRQLQIDEVTELPADFPIPKVGKAWHDLVHAQDPKRALQALAASTMMAIRKSLRNGRAWIDHSLSYRERDQMLISLSEWARDRDKYISMLGLPADPDEFLAPQLALLEAGLAAVAEACAKGDVEIGSDGMLHLPVLAARPDDGERRKTRDAIFKVIGPVQLPEVLLEIDAHTNFSEELLGRRAQSEDELVCIYGGLLAHGTDLDAKGVAAMIPGLTAASVSAAMRALEAPGRLRRANERVVEFQGRIPIAANWGTGEKASSDMMALDASVHLFNARVDPRRRTYGIGTYAHVLDRWGICYDQPVIFNERQQGVALHGVEQHNRSQDRIRIALLAVDTHGYTNAGMGVGKGLKIDVCPRLRDLSERKLYLPAGFAVPEGIERVVVKRLSLRAIRLGYDDYLRLLASIRSGRIGADVAMRFLSSAAQGDRMYRAVEHIGRLVRSIFLCDYVTIEDFRREIHTLLSRGESVHQLERAILEGKIQPERGRRRDEMTAISGALTLLTNIVIAWNTNQMHTVVEQLRKRGVRIEDSWLRRMGPGHSAHINFRGTFRFGVHKYAHALVSQTAAVRRADRV